MNGKKSRDERESFRGRRKEKEEEEEKKSMRLSSDLSSRVDDDDDDGTVIRGRITRKRLLGLRIKRSRQPSVKYGQKLHFSLRLDI